MAPAVRIFSKGLAPPWVGFVVSGAWEKGSVILEKA